MTIKNELIETSISNKVMPFTSLDINLDKIPSAFYINACCMSYFIHYLDPKAYEKGLFEFTGDALNVISKESMLLSVGVSEETWDLWLMDVSDNNKDSVRAMMRVETLLKHADLQRMSLRGNSGDIMRMQQRYADWRDSSKERKNRAISTLPSNKRQILLSRIAKQTSRRISNDK